MADNNINQTIKKNQGYLWGLIVLIFCILITGIFFVNKIMKTNKADQPLFEDEKSELIEPDLTGAVANTFDGKVSSQVITDAQTESKENRKALRTVLDKLENMETQFKKLKEENEDLKLRITEAEKTQSDLLVESSKYEENTEEQDEGQVIQRNKIKTEEYYDSQQYESKNGVIKIESPKSSFVRKNYLKKSTEIENKERFYIPSGAFSQAIILEGADANASVTAQTTNMAPMQFKLTGELHLPANKRLSKLKGCFVTAATYGDISSERAIVRTERLSCIINGKHIDQPVKGHVAFYGKNGIKGTPVMRNGKILGLAFAAGALGGVGNAASQIGSTQAGLGASRTIGASDVLREAAGGAASTAANKLADYYIQRAEQYHPVIPIGSANRVEVIFQEGFWAEFVEDMEATQDNVKEVKKVTQSAIPEELNRQLDEVKNQSLSDFVTPNQ